MNIQPYNTENALPLTPQTFHILLALAPGPLNGYQLTQQCKIDSEGDVTITRAATYKALKRLQTYGFVAAAEDAPGEKYFDLTEFGRDILQAEVKRLSAAVGLAQSRLSDAPRAGSGARFAGLPRA